MNDVLTVLPPARLRLPIPHLIHADDLDRPLVEALLGYASAMEAVAVEAQTRPLQGRILATLFFEPSTRTRLSFEAAMLRLGGAVISGADAGATSSATKGETLEDSIRVVSGYADLIVLRHPAVGAAARAAAVAGVPVINAGDGTGQHPTQALLDLYTMLKELGRLDGLRIGLCGDLKHGRTVHSLALLAGRFDLRELLLIAPDELQLPDDVLNLLRQRHVPVRRVTTLDAVIEDLDVLYQTRLQRERLQDLAAEASLSDFRITPERMHRLTPAAIVMHPLPRTGEVDPAIDPDPRAAYFRQAHNGLFVRMAILHWLASESPANG
jgi:aspartate carbamoyltransferase catalytic subunit